MIAIFVFMCFIRYRAEASNSLNTDCGVFMNWDDYVRELVKAFIFR